MELHDHPTTCSEPPLDATEAAPHFSRIRRHSSYALDQWTVEIFVDPDENHFLARVAGLPGLVGRGSTEAASVSQLRRLLSST